MENESIKQRRMGIDHKGNQGQAQSAVVPQEEDESGRSLPTFQRSLLPP
jgi:hypothetical protein